MNQMPAQPINGRLRVVVLVVLSVSALSGLLSCGGSGNPAGLGETTGVVHGSTPGLGCALPSEGCACANEGQAVPCGTVDHRVGSFVTCSMGTRMCAGGSWGACIGTSVSTKFVPDDMLSTLNLGSATATGNACDPTGMIVSDTPTGVDAGSALTVTDAGGLTLSAAGGISNCTSMTVSPPNPNINVTQINPSVTTGPPSLSFSVTMQPPGCLTVTPTPTWGLDRVDIATINSSGTFNVYTAIAAPVTVTAYFGSLQASAVVNVSVHVVEGNGAPFVPAPSLATQITQWIYPYSNAVFPLGLTGPVLQYATGPQAGPSGLVAYYPLAGDTNDYSGNGHNATNSGATLTTGHFGGANTAFSFNGTNNSMSASGASLPTGNAARTLTMWVKPNTGTTQYGVVYWGSGGCNGKMFGLGTTGTEAWGGCNDAGNGQPLPVGSWSFVAAAFTPPNQMRVFVSTTGKTYTLGTNPNTTSGTSLWFGAWGSNGASSGITNYFNGAIDSVRVYNRALSDAEIANVATLGQGTVIPPAYLVQATLQFLPGSSNFVYSYVAPETSPPQITIPQNAWQAFEQSARGNDAQLILQRDRLNIAGNLEASFTPLTIHFANAQLKGTVYYSSYNSALANPGTVTGATLAITPGASAPTLAVSATAGACYTCHSENAQGNTLYMVNPDKASSKIYNLPSGTVAQSFSSAQPFADFTYAGWYPDGEFAMTNSNDNFITDANNSSLVTPAATAVALNGWNVTKAVTPVFSPDGLRLGFNFWTGTTTNGVAAGNGSNLAIADFNCGASPGATTCSGATPVVSNYRQVYTNASGYTPSDPSFLPDGTGVVYQVTQRISNPYQASNTNTSNSALAQIYLSNVTANSGTASTPTILSKLNGTGYLPQVGPFHSDGTTVTFWESNGGCPDGNFAQTVYDSQLNFKPSVSPKILGGYSWALFTSRRLYGNTATDTPWPPEGCGIPVTPPTKKLWVAAIDQSWTPGTDPSHPAIYLPGQELNSGNYRANWVANACAAPGASCTTNDDCCPNTTGGGPSGLVAYWPLSFDTKDYSGNGHDAVNFGATPTTGHSGAANSAYLFNGTSNYMVAPGTSLPTGNAARTLAMWIKPTNANLNYGIGYWGQGNCTANMFGLGNHPGEVFWVGCDDAGGPAGLTVNAWTFVAAVFTPPNQVRVFINGTGTTYTLSTNPNTQASSFWIGAQTTTNAASGIGAYFTGAIDSIRVYNRALSDNEVATVQALPPAEPTGLLYRFPFNGDTKDYSGNGNDAVNNGATLTSGHTGSANTAYLFNGTSSYMIAPGTKLPQGNAPRTLTMWVKPTNTNLNYGISAWGQGDCSNGGGNMFGLGSHPNEVFWGGCDDVGGASGIPMGSWTFLAASFTPPNQMRLFINGTGTTYALAANPQTQPSSLWIGGETVTNATTNIRSYFAGAIDEERIYNRALSDAEVGAVMTASQTSAQAACQIDTPVASPPTHHCAIQSGCSAPGGSCLLDSDCCGGPTIHCVSNVCQNLALLPTPATFTRNFTSSCPSGTKVTWELFQWQSITPTGTSIVFQAQTGDTLATLGPAVGIGTAQPPPTSTSTWTDAGQTVDSFLRAASPPQASHDVLHVLMTLNPSGSVSPTLTQWQVYYDCPASE
jgi:hypothetical protein